MQVSDRKLTEVPDLARVAQSTETAPAVMPPGQDLQRLLAASGNPSVRRLSTVVETAQRLPGETRKDLLEKLARPEARPSFSVRKRFESRVAAGIRDWLDRNHTTYLLRVAFTTGRESICGRLAIAAFERAMARVPAYERFVADQGVTRLTSWRDIPIMTKDNYVKAYGNPAILVDGKIPAGQVDQSSGSTGKPSVWYRNPKELASTANLMKHVSRVVFRDTPVTIINTFALGPWATGITVHNSMIEDNTMHAVGPDLDRCMDAIAHDAAMAKATGQKRAQVVAGYPPFLKSLSERITVAKEKGELDTSHVELWAVGGGEAMTPVRRAQLKRGGFEQVRSSYGASDLTINIGAQDDWCVAVEDACAKNPELARELFGRPIAPSLFHYDPGDYYIEHVPVEHDGQLVDRLLFTQLREVTCPKVRYDLGDEGGIRDAATMQRILKKHGVDLPRPHALPSIFVWGRVENAVVYCGSKVTPDHLLGALTAATDDKGTPLSQLVENFAFQTYEADDGTAKVTFLLELRDGVRKDALPSDTLDRIINAIRDASQDFREATDINGRGDLGLTVFERGTGPNFHPNPNTKKRYFFKGKDLK